LLAEKFIVIDSDSSLWLSARPLLDIVLRFDQIDETYSWNGWSKQQIRDFLNCLPSRSSLVVGVWETLLAKEGSPECENLVIDLICEIIDGEVCSVRTFDVLTVGGLKPSIQLEPGIDDAREIIRQTEKLVAPVAWALFTEKSTWDKWLFAGKDDGIGVDKGQQLATFIRQGRCVLLGNLTKHTGEPYQENISYSLE
jgi:hypothetical protein